MVSKKRQAEVRRLIKEEKELFKAGKRKRRGEKVKPESLVRKKVETPTEEKPTIDLTPEVGRQPDDSILLNQPQEEPTTRDKVVDVAKAAGIGVAIGTGAFLAGGAILGGITTRAAIQSGFAQQIAAQGTSAVSKAAIIGKITTSKAIGAAGTFATNAKTTGLTTSFMVKAGMTLTAAGLAIGIIGSYPYSGFIKEESLQTLSFGVKIAMDSGDLEGAQKAIDQINEVLNPTAWDKILATIPFLNVHVQLKDFFLAAATKNENDQEALDKARRVQSGEEESDFAKSRRISDEAARERELGFREEDEEFFQGLREETELREREREEEETEKFARIAEERETRDEEERVAQEEESVRFEEIRERNKQEDLEDLKFKAEYFDLIREGRFDEAAELLASQ